MTAIKKIERPTPEMVDLLRKCGSSDENVARASQRELAVALTLPLRQGLQNGDIIGNIFETIEFQPGASIEFPLDFLTTSNVGEFVSYTLPNHGYIPQRNIESDFLMVPTYKVGCSIDWNLKYMKEARWDIVNRAMQVLEGAFVRKDNVDGWHTLISAAAGRNIIQYDDNATAGLFTKRVVALLQVTMQRNAGGNTTSQGRGQLTDMFISPEAHQDVLSWDLTQIPDALRQSIYMNWGNGGLTKIGPVTLHDLIELGVGQEFQTYYATTLAGTMPTDKVEIGVGLDLVNRDSFVAPVRIADGELEIFEDMMLHRQQRAGLYGWKGSGFAVLDNRRALLLAI